MDINALEEYNLEEAASKALVKDDIAKISLTPEEQRLFQTIEDAAIAFENNAPPFHLGIASIQAMGLPLELPTAAIVHSNNKPKQKPKPKPKPIEIRIAGGWVRDKIMNKASHDVDIALDSLSGHQFAIIVQQFLIHQQLQLQLQLQLLNADTNANATATTTTTTTTTTTKKPKIAVIAANPSQSKHLETATMRIHNIDCDFVHLRGGEIYSPNSRIPTLQQNATPLDDALRRDFTVNSLFYNLRFKYVEDWTGRGIQDLTRDKLLVTPLDARITFHDDPLRVLRAVRFAVRYDLELSQEIRVAAMSDAVHQSLHVKVSRERVGKELEGMLTGRNARPCVALKMITELKLAGCVFEFPHLNSSDLSVMGNLHGVDFMSASVDASDASASATSASATSASATSEEDRKRAREMSWEEAAELLKYCAPVIESFGECMNAWNQAAVAAAATVMETEMVSATITEKPKHETSTCSLDHRIFYLSTFLHPLRNMICVDGKGREVPLVSFIIRESIKYPNRDTLAIATLLRCIDEVRSILVCYDPCDESTFCRLRTGLMLRNLKDLWVTALLVAAIVEMHAHEQDSGDINRKGDSDGNANGVEQVPYFINKAFSFFGMVQKHGLDGCWKVRPLLDGKAILKSLELPRGPIIGTYLEEQVKWMLLHPDGSKDECELHLKEVRKRDIEEIVANGDGDGDICMDGSGIQETSQGSPCSKNAHIG